jgi:membrane protease YdiL (CAAX protease family)
LQCRKRQIGLARGDLAALGGDDLIEDGAHANFVAAISTAAAGFAITILDSVPVSQLIVEESVDDAWREIALNLQAYAIVAGAGLVVLAAILLGVPSARRRLLPLPRLRPGNWSGAEVLLAMPTLEFAQLAVVSVLVVLLAPQGDVEALRPELMRLAILGSPVWVALTLALVTTLLFMISRTRPHQYGVTAARWPANVALGVLVFLFIAPLTFAVFLPVLLAFGTETHPIELAVKQDFQTWKWALLVFMTVVGAPLTEEVLFRGVLQGWLRRATLIGHLAFLLTVLAAAVVQVVLNPPKDLLNAVAPPAFFGLLASIYGYWLWRIGSRHLRDVAEVLRWQPGADVPRPAVSLDPDEGDTPTAAAVVADPQMPARQQEWAWANARLAIFGSAILFGQFHGWPNAVPLVVLGLGLGWLMYRTQSLIGAMACHGLFNAVACLVLARSVMD